jgi:hypothetical protein
MVTFRRLFMTFGQTLMVAQIITAMCCLPGVVLGQKLPELDHLIQFSTEITITQEKYIHEALQAHEAGLGVWVDRPNQQVKVRTHVALNAAELQSTWAPQGLTITYLGPLRRSSEELVGSAWDTEDRIPEFIDTGNPATDDQTYEIAKALWIASHPKAYEQGVHSDNPE